MRAPYRSYEEILQEQTLFENPLKLFNEWFEAARKCPKIEEPNAMCLATCTKYLFFYFNTILYHLWTKKITCMFFFAEMDTHQLDTFFWNTSTKTVLDFLPTITVEKAKNWFVLQ